jgi:peptidoglycan/xylan/chitin deacetylase (PgdA/CDA1 family)
LAAIAAPKRWTGVAQRMNSTREEERAMIENPIRWPNGYRCAVNFSFDMDAESLLHIYFPDTAHNRVAMASRLRYGPEVAVPRIVDAFKRLGLQQTFFIPGWCMEQYPRAIALIVEHGHEIAHHGYMHEKINQLTREEERAVFFRAFDSIVKATGQPPRGFRAPSGAFSRHTVDFLVEAGLDYDASLAGHDIPYLIGNGQGTLVELPHDATMDDWTQYVCLREFGYMLPIASPERATEVFRAEFDAAWRHGLLWNAVWHPFVSGRAARCDAMVELIEYMKSKGGVWFARLDEIATHVRSEIAAGWKPRVDRLPYWDAPLPGVIAGNGVLPG